MNDPPRIAGSQRVFDGRVFGVRVDRLRDADGSEHRIDVVAHGPSVAIVAVPAPGELVLVRQYRHAVGAALWEIPAGSVDPGEDPPTAARRELHEETGYQAGSLTALGEAYPTPGFCDERMHFYLARALELGDRALDEDERIEVAVVSTEAAWRLAAENRPADAKTVLALLWMESGRGEIGERFGR